MLSHEYQRDGHVFRIEVESTDQGWEIRHERDGAVVSVAHKSDWHSVERVLSQFERLAHDAPEALPLIT
jgi:hypothetical protein